MELKPKSNELLYCKEKPKINIVHNSNFTQLEFGKILSKIKNVERYSISELGALFFLYQMYVRPDSTGGNSRIQIVVREKENRFYRDFYSTGRNNFADALRTLQKDKFIDISNRELDHLKRQTFPKKFIVQQAMNKYFNEMKNKVSFINLFKDRYYRLDKPLQKGESFRPHFSVDLQERGTYRSAPPLFPLQGKSALRAKTECNFDSNLYQKGIFLINKDQDRENIFGLVRSNGDSVFFITKRAISTEFTNSKNLMKQGFPGKASSSNAPICFHKSDDITLDLIGFKSRDSGQILYHLFNYGIDNSKTVEDVVEYIIFPRHQFLTNPSRLIYESKRGTNSQLTYFLSFDFPVYHVEDLAVVYSLFKNNRKNKANRHFIEDSRFKTVQTCKK